MIDLFLTKDEVHIYKASIDFLNNLNKDEFFSLSTNEKIRSESYININDKKRFILGRYITRSILKRYTGKCFDSIDFMYNDYKKPLISRSDIDLEFNISHSGDIVLVAFARKPIGIDIEIERKIDSDLINDLIFTQKELDYLQSLKKNQLRENFLKIWTNKEAYMKAVGKGFYLPANTIEVNFGNEFNQIIDYTGNIKDEFILKDLEEISLSYKAAIAVKNSNAKIIIEDFYKI